MIVLAWAQMSATHISALEICLMVPYKGQALSLPVAEVVTCLYICAYQLSSQQQQDYQWAVFQHRTGDTFYNSCIPGLGWSQLPPRCHQAWAMGRSRDCCIDTAHRQEKLRRECVSNHACSSKLYGAQCFLMPSLASSNSLCCFLPSTYHTGPSNSAEHCNHTSDVTAQLPQLWIKTLSVVGYLAEGELTPEHVTDGAQLLLCSLEQENRVLIVT